ncbi:DUF6090 family protein [Robiginitalea sp. IMCC44478]|uniref:DUF6090 family protein n=1 Tax=Robiginitalea sp. IMCC44478 TaxID=3459122 RepID=UPI0040418B8B
MLLENKGGKYLLYALGEILLVVIGILLALQVNTWNEDRKEAKQLRVALQSIHNDIVQDSLLIHDNLPPLRERSQFNQTLLRKAYASETTLDTLVKIMKEDFPIYWISSLPFNQNTFENLKSTGAFEILPPGLKASLSDYYTTIVDYQKMAALHTDQYRTHLDEFVQHYNIIGRIHDPNYRDSYLFNANWKNIDPDHFVPRVAVVLGAYNVMYSREVGRLERMQLQIRSVIDGLTPYLD